MKLGNEASSKKLFMYFVLETRHREVFTLGIKVHLPQSPQPKCGNIMY